MSTAPIAIPSCTLCGEPTAAETLREASWVPPAVAGRLLRDHPGWRRPDGACPACVQEALLETLLEQGEDLLHERIQTVWPIDPEAAFGVVPTPLRLHADPRFTGRGVTIALVDSGFYPHPDLVEPRNAIRAWVDASRDPVTVRRFTREDTPRWPGWDERRPHQWHGLMTSVAAAGNGGLGHGLYRSLASESDLVLVQATGSDGRIRDRSIVGALDWLRENAAGLGVRVVSLSVAGDAEATPGNPIDQAIDRLVAQGITVVAAAGNDGERRLVPPAASPAAITVGGLDDKRSFDHRQRLLWHSNYGETATGAGKPEVVAPSLWVAAPVLPGSDLAAEARALFDRRRESVRLGRPEPAAGAARIAELKLITPHYQHVEGTSFAAPVVASLVACMLEASPGLTPALVRQALVASATQVPGAAAERQGAGAVDAGRAVALALAEHHDDGAASAPSPVVTAGGVTFAFHHHGARSLQVLGSWDGWAGPGVPARELEPGLWLARLARPARGRHAYKLLVDGERWTTDPANPRRERDGLGGWNSLLEVG